MEMSAAYFKAAKHVPLQADQKRAWSIFRKSDSDAGCDKECYGQHRRRITGGDSSQSKAKSVWLTSFENFFGQQQTIFDAAYDLQLQTGKAWD
ncbi:MAG: hypothetical protein RLZZ232_920 [Planctomycetota bacterium]